MKARTERQQTCQMYLVSFSFKDQRFPTPCTSIKLSKCHSPSQSPNPPFYCLPGQRVPLTVYSGVVVGAARGRKDTRYSNVSGHSEVPWVKDAAKYMCLMSLILCLFVIPSGRTLITKCIWIVFSSDGVHCQYMFMPILWFPKGF